MIKHPYIFSLAVYGIVVGVTGIFHPATSMSHWAYVAIVSISLAAMSLSIESDVA